MCVHARCSALYSYICTSNRKQASCAGARVSQVVGARVRARARARVRVRVRVRVIVIGHNRRVSTDCCGSRWKEPLCVLYGDRGAGAVLSNPLSIHSPSAPRQL
jgi:hypothetical protein